ncbi:MAG: phosphate acyltransferase PlsX [Nitrospinae bacterium]|nr:phosphate acyltransferase PlsX [Nitrospinota bacterium]
MKIAVDAMGGDNAPFVVVEGAVCASREFGADIILVGNKNIISLELEKYNIEKLSLSIKHTSEVIEMDESPSVALRKKKDSSIRVGVGLIKNGEADAFVSAGNTGAVMAAATLILRTLKGVDRPAIAVQLPTINGPVILIDAGANVDCKPYQLFQFGIMGHVFARYILDRDEPRVGVINNGEEEDKGNEATKEVYKMFKKSSLNFIGNVEGKELYQGTADVIVSDGFVGNIALKVSESLADMIGRSLKDLFSKNWRSRLGYLMVKPYLEAFKKSVDYSEYGGAPLLGVNGVCIIAHGSSSPKAIKNAIRQAGELIHRKINTHIREDIELNINIQPSDIKKGGVLRVIKRIVGLSTKREGEES